MQEQVRAYGTCAVCGRQRTASLKTRKIGNHNSAPKTPCPGREVTRIDIYLSVHFADWHTPLQRTESLRSYAQALKDAAYDLTR